jgi:tRNA (cmo5U34)-methyltransferase
MSCASDEAARHFLKGFSDPQTVANYAEGPRRFVPGVEALHSMTTLLLAERVPSDARILVLGAGGGLELAAMAKARPGWTFVGVDPAAAMLREAERVLGPHAGRADLIEGYIEDAPPGPFDGATCLLTLHFLDAAERERTVRDIHRRLKPGAPFVAAHASFPQGPGERQSWLSRYVAYAIASGADAEQVGKARAAIDASLNMFSPEQDEAILRAAGFSGVSLFYAAFTWRGWIGYA